MSAAQLVFLTILGATFLLFVTERVRLDIAALMGALALAFTGILTPEEALSGLASEPAVIVAAVFVISAAMRTTGITERIGALIMRAGSSSETRTVLVIMPVVALLASLSHHLMVTAMMLPILMRVSRDRQLSASRLLMPMSLAASLGTTLTLFSAPAFLLTSNILKAQGHGALGLFSVTPIGVVLVLLGIAFMTLGRGLLPKRDTRPDESAYLQLDYYTELVVGGDSSWVGKSVEDFQKHLRGHVHLVSWLRDGAERMRVPDASLKAGDVFIVRAAPEELASIENESGLSLHAIAKYGEPAQEDIEGDAQQLVQIIVAPHSPFAGRTIGEIDFFRNLNVLVVGLRRKDESVREELSEVRLREGDLLVLKGDQRAFAELSEHQGFLLMVPFVAEKRHRRRALLAVLIIAVAVVCAALGVAPIQLVFLAASIALVLCGCVSVDQAYREIDVRIFVMIAGVIPLGIAMQKTGTADLLAGGLVHFIADWSVFAVLLAMFWAGALLTQILSDSATAVLLVPISLAIAVKLNLPPQPLVLCTALGAVAAFLTPIGHHGNLLILHQGRYTFGDFVRVGVPLTLLISVVCAWLARALWLPAA